jgi:queuine/archaeosine tRNA-ribosyltransferase
VTSIVRAESLNVAGVTLPLPAFFPSISTVKARLAPIEYLRLLVALEYPQLLISAYDLSRAKRTEATLLRRLLRRAVKRKQVVLLDSGNYEAFWHGTLKHWTQRHLFAVLRTTPFQLAFAFDTLTPPPGVLANLGSIEAAVLRAQDIVPNGTLVPIIHGRARALPTLAQGIAKRLVPLLIGVPERELGDGLLDRCRTIATIRTALDRLGAYYPLHILGTGNPLSILAYSLSGADAFDGLEWCQTTADGETGRLHHFSHWDLFRAQSGLDLGASPYPAGVLIHNLWFYSQWLDRLRWALRTGQGFELMDKFLPQQIADQIRQIASEGKS